MSTGIESWKNLAEIGPIYPFVGTETVLVIIGLVAWIGWHVLQVRAEKKHHAETIEVYKRLKASNKIE